ncbi:glycoside hydrolase family 16 protein [Altererythrobacter sp. BO-6]|uniref:glycoside hydrolase family 16 protein n=1 Tax=Altererythrobacter sp. BO-6 TaxID=2604537 RepID=UPI0013E18FCA|nr:glycoside hydrolase family 16 protein [Altererythrobacter sp. BO-6]QIG53533.1 glycoside hydrolase family 16 protein [Altererythrobacter sp. BO-6]
MKPLNVIAASVLVLSTTAAAHSVGEAAAPVPSAPDGFVLVWSDEFDQDGAPDPANWTFEEGFQRNRELQWYQPENAFVENGVLVIEARKERKRNPRWRDPKEKDEFRWRKDIEFTSASLTTAGLRQWQYGRFEIRARITAEEGLWPAIWTLGVEGKWPAKGEIDIMEYYDGSILANFAWAAKDVRKPVWKGAKVPLAQISDDPDWDKRFHTWVMDWDEQEITLWLDDRLMNRVLLDNVKNGGKDSPLPHPFRQPHYLLLNLALGGNSGGSVENTKFPSRYEIDYVRVYQRRKDGR